MIVTEFDLTDVLVYPMYSANGVPWPLDTWLRLEGKMTTSQAAELAKRWPKGKSNGDMR